MYNNIKMTKIHKEQLINFLSTYLNKHQLYHKDDIEELNNYIIARPLGIDFYGFKLNGNFIDIVLLFAIR
jgi:hypothetical protein